jgi:hypothetical protein
MKGVGPMMPGKFIVRKVKRVPQVATKGANSPFATACVTTQDFKPGIKPNKGGMGGRLEVSGNNGGASSTARILADYK